MLFAEAEFAEIRFFTTQFVVTVIWAPMKIEIRRLFSQTVWAQFVYFWSISRTDMDSSPEKMDLSNPGNIWIRKLPNSIVSRKGGTSPTK